MTIAVLGAVAALAAVATGSAITVTRQSNRDVDVKRAIAAADAGTEVATFRLNKFAATLTTGTPCVTDPGTGVLTVTGVVADGWCPRQTEDLGDGASFSFRVSTPLRVRVAGQDVWQRRVVATGAAGAVRRRAATTIDAPTGMALFTDAVFSDQDLVMRNSSQVFGSARSNGNVITQNSAQICGNVTVGPQKAFLGGGQCSGYTAQQASEPFVLSPVVVPDTNDNARIGVLDPWTDPGSISWNVSTRVLSLANSATLTLTGSTYVFCGLTLDNSARIITPQDGTPVRIYIDPPERCGGRTTSFATYNNSTIQNDSGDPTMLQLYVAGSPTVMTDVELANRTLLDIVIYAPNSTVTFDNFTKLVGAVAAKRVVVQNNFEIRWDDRVAALYAGDVPLPTYNREVWVECAAVASGTAPDSGC